MIAIAYDKDHTSIKYQILLVIITRLKIWPYLISERILARSLIDLKKQVL